MPYLTLTLTENLQQLQLSPGLVASYDIQPGNGVRLFWDKNTHVYLLTYLSQNHTGHALYITNQWGDGGIHPVVEHKSVSEYLRLCMVCLWLIGSPVWLSFIVSSDDLTCQGVQR